MLKGEREVNQEEPQKFLVRPKHSQKYVNPDPEHRQSNAKISLVWVKHMTEKTWNWDPRLDISQGQRTRVLHITAYAPTVHQRNT